MEIKILPPIGKFKGRNGGGVGKGSGLREGGSPLDEKLTEPYAREVEKSEKELFMDSGG